MFYIKGLSPLLGGLTMIERSWNYGNLPYLVANTYGLNFIKIGGIWTFHRGAGGTFISLLWPWTWPYDLHIRIWPRYVTHLLLLKRKFLFHMLQKLRPERTHEHKDRQKHKHDENITSPHTRAVENLFTIVNNSRNTVDQFLFYTKDFYYFQFSF